jgi:hypothetical protein
LRHRVVDGLPPPSEDRDARAKPMPLFPPVMTAVFPESFFMGFLRWSDQ